MGNMDYPSIEKKSFAPLDIESDIDIMIKDNSIQVKADGKYVVISGRVLRSLIYVKSLYFRSSTSSKMLESTDRLLRHVDINVCWYNRRLVVMGPEAKPIVLRTMSAIIRCFERKKI